MSEMIERVGDALAVACQKEFGSSWSNDVRWRLAVAAIKAMREPSKEMIDPGYSAMDAGVDFYNYDSGAGYSIEPNGPAEVWRAMVDAVLENEAQ